jgi:hypothetical protein
MGSASLIPGTHAYQYSVTGREERSGVGLRTSPPGVSTQIAMLIESELWATAVRRFDALQIAQEFGRPGETFRLGHG